MKPTTANNVINAIKEISKLFSEDRSNLLPKEKKEIRKKLCKKEVVYNFLKEKEQKGSLTNIEKNMLKKICRRLKNLKKYLEKF